MNIKELESKIDELKKQSKKQLTKLISEQLVNTEEVKWIKENIPTMTKLHFITTINIEFNDGDPYSCHYYGEENKYKSEDYLKGYIDKEDAIDRFLECCTDIDGCSFNNHPSNECIEELISLPEEKFEKFITLMNTIVDGLSLPDICSEDEEIVFNI